MLHLILYIAAVVCFLLATFGVNTKINTVALGLALFVLTFIV
jgi:hypothetical protein